MSISSKIRFTFSSVLACGIVGLVFVSLATQRSYQASGLKDQPFPKLAQQNAVPKDKERLKSHFPEIDYDAAEPSDPVERTKRRSKGKRFDGLGGIHKEPTRLSAALLNHWDLNLPPLPVGESSTVVIARTLSRAAFLSNDKGAVYTELSVKIDEVLKTNDDSVTKGSLIDINRLGGVVRYRTGEESLFLIVGQNIPEVGKRYVFFLKHSTVVTTFS